MKFIQLQYLDETYCLVNLESVSLVQTSEDDVNTTDVFFVGEEESITVNHTYEFVSDLVNRATGFGIITNNN